MTNSDHKNDYLAQRQIAYTTEGANIFLGKPKVAGEIVDVTVQVPLSTLNRHGLIAGATGTGKTKSLQILAEQLSLQGVPSLVMDIKGDMSGVAMAGDAQNTRTQQRCESLHMQYAPSGAPVEFLSISKEPGIHLRTTVTELGPILISKMLGLNDTQREIMGVIFQFCDQYQLALVDLQDLKTVIQYIGDQGKEIFSQNYGHTTPASLTTILRAIINLEQQDGTHFFGEPSFDINDLLQQKDGKGIINILRLTDMQTKPVLFSVCMLSLLGELFHTLPEAGDLDKPKLVIFIDEAHLIFKNASKELLDTLETTMKLIRSKGVGVIFCTQLPDDIPDSILSQLGLRIQHALRAVTAKDRDTIEKAVKNFPESDIYDIANDITSLGIGEAFITCLNEKGIPTPLVWTYMVPPVSRMDILTPSELTTLVSQSSLVEKYSKDIDAESAHEILQRKMRGDDDTGDTDKDAASLQNPTKDKQANEESPITKALTKIGTKVATNMAKGVGNSLIRGLFGKIGIKIDGRRTFF